MHLCAAPCCAQMHKYIKMLQCCIMSCDMVLYGVSIKHLVARQDVKLWHTWFKNAPCVISQLAHEAYLKHIRCSFASYAKARCVTGVHTSSCLVVGCKAAAICYTYAFMHITVLCTNAYVPQNVAALHLAARHDVSWCLAKYLVTRHGVKLQ
jgi:hypothetical protein